MGALSNSKEKLGQEAVAEGHPCHHAFNDEVVPPSTGTDKIWDVVPTAKSTGLTSENVYACSTRQIERDRLMDRRDGDAAIVDGVVDFGGAAGEIVCDAIGSFEVVAAPVGVGGTKGWDMTDLCKDIAGLIAG